MNNKVLAILAVVVTLLCGWLVVSLLNQPNVSLSEGQVAPQGAPVLKEGGAKDAVKDGENGEVSSSVRIPVDEVKTSVQIKK